MKNNKVWKDIQKAFNTGVSYMLPSVVVGGILLAVALATGTATDTGMEVTNPFMKNLNDLGSAGFAMMIPILSGYIAYSLAGKPGIAPGMILGYVANNPIGESEVKTGFLGAMILGLATGYLVRWCKTWKVSNTIKTIMPILIVPIFTTFILGIIYIYVISVPIGACMDWLVKFLSGMQGGNAVLLGAIIGAMTAVDMGGPINKSAWMAGNVLMTEGIYQPNVYINCAICIPPLAYAIATIIKKHRFSPAFQEAGKGNWVMGFIGITEVAIPFTLVKASRLVPINMIGGAIGAGLCCLLGATATIPPVGGMYGFVSVGNGWAYLIGIIVGALFIAIVAPMVVDFNEDTQISEEISEDDIEIEIQI